MHLLHVSLEYKVGVGGLKSFTTGLLPALSNYPDVDVAIVTPYYDVYDSIYKDIKRIATIQHYFKGEKNTSHVYRVVEVAADGSAITHYLIKPIDQFPVKRLFAIGAEEKLYQKLDHSQPRNRLEYFNSAVAAMVRIPNDNIPKFDIVHVHTWHASLAACLIKEFQSILNYETLIPTVEKQLTPIPHIVFTIHMLLERENGLMASTQAIRTLLGSLGLPANFELTFLKASEHIGAAHLKLHVLGLLYADQVSIVSKSVINEIRNGVAHGIYDVLTNLLETNRLTGITNGIPHAKWDPSSIDNLGQHAFNPSNIYASKQNLKQHLGSIFSQLYPDKKWVLFVGRFASEKGIDLLAAAHAAIRSQGCILIVMGIHVTLDPDHLVHHQIRHLQDQEDILVISDAATQRRYGKLLRAASEFTLTPSNNETGGLVPMEALANASIPVASNLQGFPDSVIPLSESLDSGSGFLFGYDEGEREENIKQVLVQALSSYETWCREGKIEGLLQRIKLDSKRFDWAAEAVTAYYNLYLRALAQPVVTFDQIRTVATRKMLNQFNLHTQSPQTQLIAPKIFQIGFNKCGTLSLHSFFYQNNIRGIHYGHGKLATSIYENFNNGRPLLSEHYVQFPAYFDIENIYSDPPIFVAEMFFKELDQQHPGSKFILNTRDKQAWLKSRSLHVDENNGKKYMDTLCAAYKLTPEQMIERWSKDWDVHHTAVLEYFKDRPNDLLIYNIDLDPPEKIEAFFSPYYKLDMSHLKHLHKTPTLDLAL